MSTQPVTRPTNEAIRVGDYHVGLGGNQKLYRSVLVNSDLRLIDFRGADFRQADLRGCDFTGSNLTVAKLLGAHLADANFFLVTGLELPSGWELVNHRAQRKTNWRFDEKGRGFFEDRGRRSRELGTSWED